MRASRSRPSSTASSAALRAMRDRRRRWNARQSSYSIRPLKRPQLYPLQDKAFYCDEQFSLVEASTKSGKTVGAFTWQVDEAWHGPPGVEHWWIAPYSEQAGIAWRRVKRGFRREPDVIARKNPKRIVLPNDARIIFKSGDNPDGLYGEDVYTAVVDEASRCREDAWIALQTTMTATNGRCRLIGNVTDDVNWFHNLCRLVEQADPADPIWRNWRYGRIVAQDAVDAGLIAPDTLANIEAVMPHHAFRALYWCEPPEGGINPLGTTAEIEACIEPINTGLPPTAQGWDLAKRRNYTAGVGLNILGTTSLFERWHGGSWMHQVPRIVGHVGPHYALVDQTGLGDAPVEMMQAQTHGTVVGFTFDYQSKQDLMTQLALSIQGREIRYPAGQIVEELKRYQYDFDPKTRKVVYRAPEDAYDDCVDALALAVQAWRSPESQPPARRRRVYVR